MKKSIISRIISLIITLSLVAGSFGIVSVGAAKSNMPSIDKNFIYNLSGNEVTIVGFVGNGGKVTVPAKINNKTVTAIGAGAFSMDAFITSITIPEGVKSIGDSAFHGAAVKTVNLPKSLTSIGEEAFFMCEKLTSITIPGGVKTIGGGAFSGSGIKTLKLDKNNNFTYTSGVLFDKKQTKLITSVQNATPAQYTVPSSVKAIDNYAFAGNIKITSLKMSNNVTSIGEGAFQGLEKLTTVTLSTKLKELNDLTFADCIKLPAIKLPKGLTLIGTDAFSNCAKLSAVTIPTSVKTIEIGAFENCASLKKIEIPASVTKIEGNIFTDCTALTAISVNKNNKSFSDSGGVLFDKNKTKLIAYPSKKAGAKYSIPKTVKTIGSSAFYGSLNLTQLDVPASVSTIENLAFANCKKLAKISSLKSIKNIPEDIFNGTTKLQK